MIGRRNCVKAVPNLVQTNKLKPEIVKKRHNSHYNLSLFVLLSLIGDPPIQAMSLEEAMGPDVQVRRL